MALTSLRGRLATRAVRPAAGVDALAGLRPTRLLLAALLGMFVLALVYVLHIQSLVQIGSTIATLEDGKNGLSAALRRQEALRIEIEKLHDLALIERRALFDLDLVAHEQLNLTVAPQLPPEIELSSAGWPRPAKAARLHWWERALIRLHALIDSAKQPPDPATTGG